MLPNNNILRKLQKFQQNIISQKEAEEMILDWYEPFKVYTRKLDGTRMIRDAYTVAGPSGRARYDYSARGYMVYFDADKMGFRTLVFRNVYKIEKNGKTYIVR